MTPPSLADSFAADMAIQATKVLRSMRRPRIAAGISLSRAGRSLTAAIIAPMAAASCATAPQRPAPVLAPETAWGLVHFVQALNDPTGTQFAGWSSALVARGPEPKLRGKLGEMHHQLGDCELKKVLEGGAVGGEAALRCSRGILTVRWTVAAEPPHELESLSIKDGFAIRYVP